jgi:hypothetical protein
VFLCLCRLSICIWLPTLFGLASFASVSALWASLAGVPLRLHTSLFFLSISYLSSVHGFVKTF